MDTKNLDRRLTALPPAGRLVLSTSHGFTVVAERSGDGRRLRIVRESAEGFRVLSDTSR